MSYTVCYRRDLKNVNADTMSRLTHISNKRLVYSLHHRLAHPGITCLWHNFKSHSLPYSRDDVESTIAYYFNCRSFKPHFALKATGTLLKSTQLLKRLSLDLVGPKAPSLRTRNTFILTVFDENSRFPFPFPLHATSSQSIIKCVHHFICSFRVPHSIHSDCGTQYIPKEFIQFCHENGFRLTKTAQYHRQCNG